MGFRRVESRPGLRQVLLRGGLAQAGCGMESGLLEGLVGGEWADRLQVGQGAWSPPRAVGLYACQAVYCGCDSPALQAVTQRGWGAPRVVRCWHR